MAVYYLKDAKATISSFAYAPIEIEFKRYSKES